VAPCQARSKSPLAHVAGTCPQWQGKCCQQAGSDALLARGSSVTMSSLFLFTVFTFATKRESLEEGIIARTPPRHGPVAHDAVRIRRAAWFSLYRCHFASDQSAKCPENLYERKKKPSKAHFPIFLRLGQAIFIFSFCSKVREGSSQSSLMPAAPRLQAATIVLR
jgi:hypothetical protein